MCAMYFLWPCQSLDGQHIPSGYSNLPDVMLAMTNMEASGIATRFPHPTHLYKVFLSKDWTSQLCLFPEMRIPATTKVSRSAVERNALGAARAALATLQRLSTAQDDAVKRLRGGVGGGRRLRSALAENIFGGDGGARGRAESSAVRSSRGTTARRAESFP